MVMNENESNESCFNMDPNDTLGANTSYFGGMTNAFKFAMSSSQNAEAGEKAVVANTRLKSLPHFLLTASKNKFSEIVIKELKKLMLHAINETNTNEEYGQLLSSDKKADDVREGFVKMYEDLKPTHSCWKNCKNTHPTYLLMTSIGKQARSKYMHEEKEEPTYKKDLTRPSSGAITEANLDAKVLNAVKQEIIELDLPKMIRIVNRNSTNITNMNANVDDNTRDIKKHKEKIDENLKAIDENKKEIEEIKKERQVEMEKIRKENKKEMEDIRKEFEEEKEKFKEELKKSSTSGGAKPDAQQCLQIHIKEKMLYRRDVFRERHTGRVKFFFKDKKRYLTGDVNGEPKDQQLNYQNLQHDTGVFIKVIRFIKSSKGNWSAICLVSRPGEDNADVSKEIIFSRKELGEGYFGIAPCHPVEHDITNTLLAWKDKEIIFDFDIIRAGFLIIYLNDGNEDIEDKKGLEFKKSCTAIKPFAPNTLPTMTNPTIAKLKLLANPLKYFVGGGEIFEVDDMGRNPKIVEL